MSRFGITIYGWRVNIGGGGGGVPVSLDKDLNFIDFIFHCCETAKQPITFKNISTRRVF